MVLVTKNRKSFDTWYLTAAKTILKNKALRQAICYAIDTEAMIRCSGGDGYASNPWHSKYADYNENGIVKNTII